MFFQLCYIHETWPYMTLYTNYAFVDKLFFLAYPIFKKIISLNQICLNKL